MPLLLPPAKAAAICKTKVDLPIPGSPANNNKEPGTNPPPKTVSISGKAILILTARETLCQARLGADCAASPSACFIVPHFPHSPHCPCHLGYWESQLRQV